MKVFLIGKAVECEELTDSKFDVRGQLLKFVEVDGDLLACGTCLEIRKKEGSDACPVSTMIDCVEMVEWADKTVTF